MSNEQQIKLWNSSYGHIWANNADVLDEVFGAFNHEILSRAHIKSGENILDFGCGSGALSLLAAEETGPQGLCIGVDVSKPLIEVARLRQEKTDLPVRFVETDATTWQTDTPFDLVISRFGNSYFDDHIAGYTNLHAQMRPGGRLVGITWMSLQRNPWARLVYETVIPFLREVPALPPIGAPGPFAFARSDDITDTLQAAGWRETKMETWAGAVPFPAEKPEDAASLILSLGPMAKIAESQRVDMAPVYAAVADALASKGSSDGAVMLEGTAWIFSAIA